MSDVAACIAKLSEQVSTFVGRTITEPINGTCVVQGVGEIKYKLER